MQFPELITTLMSDEFVAAIKERGTADPSWPKYPVEFNRTDWDVFITILQKLADYGNVSHKDIPEIVGWGDDEEEPVSAWARDWLSGIAITLNIEGI